MDALNWMSPSELGIEKWQLRDGKPPLLLGLPSLSLTCCVRTLQQHLDRKREEEENDKKDTRSSTKSSVRQCVARHQGFDRRPRSRPPRFHARRQAFSSSLSLLREYLLSPYQQPSMRARTDKCRHRWWCSCTPVLYYSLITHSQLFLLPLHTYCKCPHLRRVIAYRQAGARTISSVQGHKEQ